MILVLYVASVSFWKKIKVFRKLIYAGCKRSMTGICMESVYDWKMLYLKFADTGIDFDLNWFHGISIFVSIALFALVFIRCIRFDYLLFDSIKSGRGWYGAKMQSVSSGETVKRIPAPEYLVFSAALILFYYLLLLLVAGGIVWIRFLDYQNGFFYLMPPVIAALIAAFLEKRIAPGMSRLQILNDAFEKKRKSIRWLLVVKNPKLKGCLFYPLFYFTFVILNSGLMVSAVSMLNTGSPELTVVQGVLADRIGAGHGTDFLEIRVEEARVLESEGPGKVKKLPRMISLSAQRYSIPENLEINDRLIIVYAHDYVTGFVDVIKRQN